MAAGKKKPQIWTQSLDSKTQGNLMCGLWILAKIVIKHDNNGETGCKCIGSLFNSKVSILYIKNILGPGAMV